MTGRTIAFCTLVGALINVGTVFADVPSKPGRTVGLQPISSKPAVVANEGDSTFAPSYSTARPPEGGSVVGGGGGEGDTIIIEASDSLPGLNGWTLERTSEGTYDNYGQCSAFDFGTGVAASVTNCFSNRGNVGGLYRDIYEDVAIPFATVSSRSQFVSGALSVRGGNGVAQVLLDRQGAADFDGGTRYIELASFAGAGRFGSSVGWTKDPSDSSVAVLLVGSPDEDRIYRYRIGVTGPSNARVYTFIDSDFIQGPAGTRFGTSIASNGTRVLVGSPGAQSGDGQVEYWSHDEPDRTFVCVGRVGSGDGMGEKVANTGQGVVAIGQSVLGYWNSCSEFFSPSFPPTPRQVFRGPPSFGHSLASTSSGHPYLWVAVGAPSSGASGAVFMFNAGPFGFEFRGTLEFPFAPDNALVGWSMVGISGFDSGGTSISTLEFTAPNWDGGDVRRVSPSPQVETTGRVVRFIRREN